jgi:hypothetical protein
MVACLTRVLGRRRLVTANRINKTKGGGRGILYEDSITLLEAQQTRRGKAFGRPTTRTLGADLPVAGLSLPGLGARCSFVRF